MAINEDELNAFLRQAVSDLGGAVSAVLVSIGDELGYYRVLAQEHLTPAKLAEKTGTHERYAREWLANQAAGGYVAYQADSGEYFLSEEQAVRLANRNRPMDVPGTDTRSRASGNFRSRRSVEWGVQLILDTVAGNWRINRGSDRSHLHAVGRR